ncbi:uncharacterized protein [Ambystoma mexicanum]|uniref:uncharacterized protein n=1 Tax=Ambystoma mexicanum TaxID=8296 RepID=UPI0037E76AE9
MSFTNRKCIFALTAITLAIVYYMNWYATQLRFQMTTGETTNSTDMTVAKRTDHREQSRYIGQMSKSTITPLENARTLVINAYHDNREINKTRIIAIVCHQEVKELYCWNHCRSRNGFLSIKKATLEVHNDRFGFPCKGADVLCVEPPGCDPKYVSIHWGPEADSDQLPVFEIKNRNPGPISANFTVCISTLFGNYNNILQAVQSIEMYKLLGAQKVVIYKNNCSAALEKILQYYSAEGTVEVVAWPIHEHLSTTNAWKYSKDPKDIGYYGQLVTLNDCIYRNMYRSKYVILNDLDEIILPFKHVNWPSMMESLQKQHPDVDIFLFENHIFPKTEFTSTPMFNTASWRFVPGEDILQHVHREPDRATFFNGRKMILNPRKVIQTSVHSVLKAYGKSLKVLMDVAIVYHCRGPLQAALPKSLLIRDITIWRYNGSLITNVNEVLTKTKQIPVT